MSEDTLTKTERMNQFEELPVLRLIRDEAERVAKREGCNADAIELGILRAFLIAIKQRGKK